MTDGDTDGALTGPRRQLYGRRTGHRLRATRQAMLDDVLPRLTISLPPTGEPLDPSGLFDGPKRAFQVEIGFGGGEHLVAQATAHPNVGFIGCEPFLSGMANLICKVEDSGLCNVRVLADDARLLLAALPPASLERVYLLFPDPWPKTRHHKRRFIQVETLDLIARVLALGGEFRMASDIMGYIDWTLTMVLAHSAFRWTARGPDDWRVRSNDWPSTRYERKALEVGRKPAYLRFVRDDPPAAP